MPRVIVPLMYQVTRKLLSAPGCCSGVRCFLSDGWLLRSRREGELPLVADGVGVAPPLLLWRP
jgi:hypothetical protein